MRIWDQAKQALSGLVHRAPVPPEIDQRVRLEYFFSFEKPLGVTNKNFQGPIQQEIFDVARTHGATAKVAFRDLGMNRFEIRGHVWGPSEDVVEGARTAVLARFRPGAPIPPPLPVKDVPGGAPV